MNALRSALLARGLKVNVVAGVIGNGWSALIQLAFIPVYVRFMGIEAYGLSPSTSRRGNDARAW